MKEQEENDGSGSAVGCAADVGGEYTREISDKSEDLGALYDSEYYQRGCGPVPYDRSQPQWPRFFGGIAGEVIKALQPRCVLDAGCALGFLVEAFWDRGVEAWGIDISPFAIANVRRDMRPYCRVGSIAKDIEGCYDVITCIEVLEHMREADGIEAIERMCRCTSTILFSSSPYDFQEPTHFNVRPLMYWLGLFQKNGFSPELQFDASFVAPHAMLLRRCDRPVSLEVLQAFANLLHARQGLVSKETQYNEAIRDLRVSEARAAEDLNRVKQDLQDVVEQLNREQGKHAESVARLKSELGEKERSAIERERGLAERQQRIGELEELQAASNAKFSVELGASQQRIRELEELLTASSAKLSAAETACKLLYDDQVSVRNELRGMAEKVEQIVVSGPILPAQDRDNALALSESTANSIQFQVDGLEANAQRTRDEVRHLERRLNEMNDSVASLAGSVNSLVKSRIWRSLVRGGGILLRFGHPLKKAGR